MPMHSFMIIFFWSRRYAGSERACGRCSRAAFGKYRGRIGMALLQHAVVGIKAGRLVRQLRAVDRDVFQVAVAGIAVALDRTIGRNGRQALACQVELMVVPVTPLLTMR